MLLNKRLFQKSRFQSSLWAGFFHLLLSLLVAFLVACFVFLVLYPWPFFELARGVELFWIVVSVDVVCGPLLTAVLWNPQKSNKERALDLTLVAFIQIVAFGYGVQVLAESRPVWIAFEVDRFRVVLASEVDVRNLNQAPPELQKLSWIGPRLVGVRDSRSGEETLRSIELSLTGQEPSLRPGWWQNYELNKPDVKRRMRQVQNLLDSHLPEDRREVLLSALKNIAKQPKEVNYLPLVSYRSLDDWIVFLDSNADIIGYVPLGGF